jgi:peptidoglycan/xylan/chitin deacetylase (PgdA/CDA1 family)
VHLAFWRRALRVLCYHRVTTEPSRFAVTPEQLDTQLRYLVRAGFQFIHARDLASDEPLPPQPLLLTFDDGYVDTLELAQPVLRQRGVKATVFIVSAYVGDRARWSEDAAALMTVQQLRMLDPTLIELGLHSHAHRSFSSLSIDEIEADIRNNQAFFAMHDLAVAPVLAYPYGARPQNSMVALSQRLAALKIRIAFRIGNRVNRLPIADPYQIQRIDVRGDESAIAFRRKLWIGKLL